MPEAVKAAAELGVDVSSHSARRLRPEDVRDADLIVGMAAEHLEDVQALVLEAESRTFTLKELVRLLEDTGPAVDATASDGGLAGAVSDAHRRRTGSPASAEEDDVMDPLGLSLHGYRVVASELEDLCERLASGLYGGRAVASRRVG
jgi:protein-tyrosine-phosphatase